MKFVLFVTKNLMRYIAVAAMTPISEISNITVVKFYTVMSTAVYSKVGRVG